MQQGVPRVLQGPLEPPAAQFLISQKMPNLFYLLLARVRICPDTYSHVHRKFLEEKDMRDRLLRAGNVPASMCARHTAGLTCNSASALMLHSMSPQLIGNT